MRSEFFDHRPHVTPNCCVTDADSFSDLSVTETRRQQPQHLLFAAPKGKPFTLELDGTVTKPAALTLQVKVSTVHAWPMGQHQTRLRRPLLLNVPNTAVVQSTNGSTTRKTTILSALKGQTVKVWTMPATASLKTERGDDLSLTAALVLLKIG